MFATPLNALFGLGFLIAPFLLTGILHGRDVPLRSAFIRALLWVFFVAFVLTEVASALHLILAPLFQIFWLAAATVLFVLWRRKADRVPFPGLPPGLVDRAIIVAILVVIVLILGAAVMSGLGRAPNNYDSMTYRLPRVEHFVQNGTLAPFPTGIVRQIALTPFGEILLLQFRLLSGGDGYFWLIQWLSLIGSLCAVSRIAELLGAPPRGQWLAMLALATIPMAILQASTTQVDLLTGFLALALVERVLDWRRNPRPRTAAELGIVAGMGVLTKGTALFVGLPFGIWFGLLALARLPERRSIAALALAGTLPVLMFAPHLMRQYTAFGGPVAKIAGTVLVDSYGPVQTVHNVVRHFAMNLKTGDPAMDGQVDAAVARIERLIGAERYLADTTYAGQTFDVVWPPWANQHEDLATAPLHVIAILLVLFGALLVRGPDRRAVLIYAVATAAALLLFSSAMRWQTWGTRLQLPALFIAMPLIGVVLSALTWRVVQVAVGAVFATAAYSPAVHHMTRPPDKAFTLPHSEAVFVNYAVLGPEYTQAVDKIIAAKITAVGIASIENGFEYPLWALMRERQNKPFRIEHLVPAPELAAVPRPLGPFDADALITIDQSGVDAGLLATGDWTLAHEGKVVRLYLHKRVADRLPAEMRPVPPAPPQPAPETVQAAAEPPPPAPAPVPPPPPPPEVLPPDQAVEIAPAPEFQPRVAQLEAAGFPRFRLALTGADTAQVLLDGVPTPGGALKLEAGWRVVGFADFHGKGAPQILGVRLTGGPATTAEVATWTLDAKGAIKGRKIQGELRRTGWEVAGIADVDGKPGADIVWHKLNGGGYAVWSDPDRKGDFTAKVLLFPVTREQTGRVVGLVDIDGDGAPELLARRDGEETLQSWEVAPDADGRVRAEMGTRYDTLTALQTKAALVGVRPVIFAIPQP